MPNEQGPGREDVPGTPKSIQYIDLGPDGTPLSAGSLPLGGDPQAQIDAVRQSLITTKIAADLHRQAGAPEASSTSVGYTPAYAKGWEDIFGSKAPEENRNN